MRRQHHVRCTGPPGHTNITSLQHTHQQSRNCDNKNSLMALLENQRVNPSLPLRVPFGALTHSFAAKLGLSSVSSLQTRPAVGRFVCHPLSLRLSLSCYHCVSFVPLRLVRHHPFNPSLSFSRSYLSHLVDHVPSHISISFSLNPWERSIECLYVLAHRSVQFGR